MLTQEEATEYLDEIRHEVCRHCPERPPAGPPCQPLGKLCGVELHLPHLIRSIREVKSNRIEPYLDHNRREICAACDLCGGSNCPCPMDYLSVLVVQAVESAEGRLEQWQYVRNRLRDAPKPSKVHVSELYAAYEAATGTCLGCD
jgi:hypothetical protein